MCKIKSKKSDSINLITSLYAARRNNFNDQVKMSTVVRGMVRVIMGDVEQKKFGRYTYNDIRQGKNGNGYNRIKLFLKPNMTIKGKHLAWVMKCLSKIFHTKVTIKYQTFHNVHLFAYASPYSYLSVRIYH